MNAHGTNGKDVTLRNAMKINGRWRVFGGGDKVIESGTTPNNARKRKIADGDPQNKRTTSIYRIDNVLVGQISLGVRPV